MSAKWQRSKRWDDEHIPSWAWPVRFVLRAFSSIPLAVVLLSLVALYAVLASVPIGLLALIPTWTIYGLTLVLAVALLAVAPVAAAWRLARSTLGLERHACFAGALVLLIALGGLSAWAWAKFVWPALHYDPATGRGLRLFASFCHEYRATTLRRLPGLEMSELEFYSWWPLRVVLLAFVVNMITATVRRIEFVFVNLGVLTVHTGIVTIALGSLYYKGLKLEGDVLLLAGEPGPDGTPTPGRPEHQFYDNTDVALWVNQPSRGPAWEQRPLSGVPRYNDYRLDAGAAETAKGTVGRGALEHDRPGRSLDLPVPSAPAPRGDQPHRVDPDVRFRVVGYASYANPERDWARAAAPDPRPGAANPVRFLDLKVKFPAEERPKTAFSFFFLPEQPAHRVADSQAFAMEYTRGMPEQRWADLTAPLPEGTIHALVVEVPAAGYKAVYPAEPGSVIDVGTTGYRIEVGELAPTPPFPIITEGYRGATSSVAIVRVTPPPTDGQAFDRWVYHRFPEISQDLLDEMTDRGMPRRRDADPAIRIAYLDASRIQVYFDERDDGTVRACVRLRGGEVRVVEGLKAGDVLEEFAPRRDADRDPKIDLVLAERWEHAEAVERPRVVPEPEREKDAVGTHAKAMLAVEVSTDGPDGAQASPTVVWLPFTRYLGVGLNTEREVKLPDGRSVTLAFGRRRHFLPGFMVQLVDFQAVKYEHRGAPRDYQSIVRVIPAGLVFEPYEHVTKLNEPLQAPYMWDDERYSWLGNSARTLTSRLNPAQFKFSQAGWDQQGWEQSQAMADRGELRRPFATFTILGVGNNPGIHIVALGGILMSVGIPWAFYVKPWILQQRKRRLQASLQAPHPPTPAPPTPTPLTPGMSESSSESRGSDGHQSDVLAGSSIR